MMIYTHPSVTWMHILQCVMDFFLTNARDGSLPCPLALPHYSGGGGRGGAIVVVTLPAPRYQYKN